MNYELEFKESALKEWHKLDKVVVIAVGKRENNLVYRNAKERV